MRKKQERKDERPEVEKRDEVKYKETKRKEPVCWAFCFLYSPGEKYSYSFRGPDMSVACSHQRTFGESGRGAATPLVRQLPLVIDPDSPLKLLATQVGLETQSTTRAQSRSLPARPRTAGRMQQGRILCVIVT